MYNIEAANLTYSYLYEGSKHRSLDNVSFSVKNRVNITRIKPLKMNRIFIRSYPANINISNISKKRFVGGIAP